MNDLIATLMTIAVGMANVSAPDALPQVKLINGQELQKMACGSVERCHDLHFFTEPTTNIIYINEKVNMKFTFAKAELLHEMARYSLAKNNIYSVKNSCTRNIDIEDALLRIEVDYIDNTVKSGEYYGNGIPTKKDLPQHVFFCVPDTKQTIGTKNELAE